MKDIIFLFTFVSTTTLAASVSIPTTSHWGNTDGYSRYVKDSPFYVRELDVGASSWAPQGLEVPSRLEKKSGFSRTSLPSLHAYTVFSALGGQGFSTWIAPELGLGVTQMERTGQMNYFGTEQGFTQTAHIFGANLGFRFESPYFDDKSFSVWQSVGFMPSLIFVSKSVFSDGSIEHALPIYGRLGFRFGPLSWAVQILAGLEATTASIAEQNIEGIGAFGGAQFRF